MSDVAENKFEFDLETSDNLKRMARVSSVDDMMRAINAVVGSLPNPKDGKEVAHVRISGFGSGMDDDVSLEAALKTLSDMGIEENDPMVLYFDGDWFRKGSITHTIFRIKQTRPRTAIIAIRGPSPPDKGVHTAFFESWAGIPIFLIEITEEMRGKSLEELTRLVGPDSTARPPLRIEDPGKLKNTMQGWFCAKNLPLAAIISLGGGDTTANEAKVFLAQKEMNPEELIPPKWHVHLLDRAGQSPGDDRRPCDPFLETFKESIS
jgi:hypothetical protein